MDTAVVACLANPVTTGYHQAKRTCQTNQKNRTLSSGQRGQAGCTAMHAELAVARQLFAALTAAAASIQTRRKEESTQHTGSEMPARQQRDMEHLR